MSANVDSMLARLYRFAATRRGLLVVVGLSVSVLFLSRLVRLPVLQETRGAGNPAPGALGTASTPDADLRADWQRVKETSRMIAPSASAAARPAAGGIVDGYGTPLISRAAELAVVTKEFARSRSGLEEILERHHGYASRLRMVGQASGSTLTATLRVPSSEFNSAVSELKTLGSVEREEQTADEITQQQADLEARLTNARNTLQRLQGMLPKSSSAVDIQRQLLEVNAEITRLEAQRSAWQNRTIFANVLFSLREEITPPVESFGAQLRKAALVGFSDAASSLSGIALFVISNGPVILVWTLLVFFPGRWMWKKWRRESEPEAMRSAQGT